MSGRRPLIIGGALVVVVLVVLALAGGSDNRVTGPSLSPRSVSDDGTKALVLLLERFGATVRTGDVVPSADAKVAVLLRDRLDDAQTKQASSWVKGGGTLIVTDPASNLSALAVDNVNGTSVVRTTCDLAGLDGVNRIDLGTGDGPDIGNGALYRVTNDATSCFGNGQTAYIVRKPLGEGQIISVGGANPFTNKLLDQDDNAVLATDLLLASGTQVTLLDPNPPGTGDKSLVDLIPTRVWEGMLQLLVAFAVYTLWRARRLGKPVLEPQPVAIAGSRLVEAVGRLHQRTGSAMRAATELRTDVRRAVVQRYGLPANAPPDAVAEVVALRTNLDRERVRWALADAPVHDEATLVQLAAELDAIRQEVLHVHR